MSSLLSMMFLLGNLLVSSALLWNAAPFTWMRAGVGTLIGGPLKLGSNFRSYVSGGQGPATTEATAITEPGLPFYPEEVPDLLSNIIRPQIIFESSRNNSSIKRTGDEQNGTSTTESKVDIGGLDGVLRELGLDRNGKKPEELVSQLAVVDLTSFAKNGDRRLIIKLGPQRKSHPDGDTGPFINSNFGNPAIDNQSMTPNTSPKSMIMPTTRIPEVRTTAPSTSQHRAAVVSSSQNVQQSNNEDKLPRPVYRTQSESGSGKTAEPIVVFEKRHGDDLSSLQYHMFREQLLGLQAYLQEPTNSRANDSDLMLSDQQSISPIVEDHEQYFLMVRSKFDNDSCVSLLICELSANPQMFGNYGQRVADFFRNYQPPSESRASIWYKTVARLGSKSKSTSLCRQAFGSCRVPVQHLIQLGENMWKKT